MKRFVIVLLCILLISVSANADSRYMGIIERHIGSRARIVPAGDIDYDTEIVFNFQNRSLLLCKKDGDCYAWENINRKAMYSACKDLLENFDSVGVGLCVRVLQQGESNVHCISNVQEAQSYLELLNLAAHN